VVDRKRAAAISKSQASLSFLAILTTDAFSFAASQLTVMQAQFSAGVIVFACVVVSKSTKTKLVFCLNWRAIQSVGNRNLFVEFEI